MQKIHNINQQYRYSIGSYTNKLDEKQSNQLRQDDYIKRLANQPGLHSANIHQHNMAQVMLQFISLLSSVRNINPAITQKIQEKADFQTIFNQNTELGLLHTTQNKTNTSLQMLDSTKNILHQYTPSSFIKEGQYIEKETDKRILISEKRSRRDIKLNQNHRDVTNKTTSNDINNRGQKALTKYYKNYNKKYPTLKKLATTILKNKIKENFNLNINPNTIYFLHFGEIEYNPKGIIQYAPAIENKTLTDWLYSNFDAETQDNLPDVDAMCGIYDISLVNRTIFHLSDAIKIPPSKFVNLVWDIDFSNYAIDKTTEFFKNKDMHIKKICIDFLMDLTMNNINNIESIKDVMKGIKIPKDENIKISFFDINGYEASNSFIFVNKLTERVTLYFPNSDFKFITFLGYAEMRSWIAIFCSKKEHRDMIASHFTTEKRQDGLFYSGIDSWLTSISKHHDESNKIATTSTEISSHFFEHVFNSTKDHAISEIRSAVISDAQVRRYEWEKMSDAFNKLLPNPITLALSFGFHLDHLIQSHNYEEKKNEYGKIKNDIVNFIALILIANIIKFPDVDGYEFLNKIESDLETKDIEHINQILNKHRKFTSTNEEQAGPSSLPLNDWSFDRYIEDNTLPNRLPLNSFLPLEEVNVHSLDQVNPIVHSYIESVLQNHDYDIFYSLDDINNDAPQYINCNRATTRLHLNSAKQHLTNARHVINDVNYAANIKHYLSLFLNTNEERILTEATSRLRVSIERAYNFMHEMESRNFNNIALISTKQIVDPNDPLLFHSPILDMNYIKEMPTAFTCKYDPLRRLFFFNDANPPFKTLGSENTFNSFPNTRNTDILHELSHVSSDTRDFFYISTVGDSSAPLRYFEQDLSTGRLKSSKGFHSFMRSFYTRLNIRSEFNEDIALDMIRADPMLKANIMMQNADNFAVYVLDLSSMKSGSRRSKRDLSNIPIDNIIKLIFSATQNRYKNYQ